MEWLVHNEAGYVTVGPFLDALDGVTPETGLAGSMAIYLSKNGGEFVARNSTTVIIHDRDGYYRVHLNTTDRGTLGRLRLQVTDEDTHIPVWETYRIVTQAEYDAAVGTSGTLYATAAEVRSFKIAGETVDLTAYSTEEIEAELDLFSRMVEYLTNDWFYSGERTVYLDGNGLHELFFYPEIPARCVSLTSVQVVEEDGTTVLRTYTQDADFKLYDHYIRLVHLLGDESTGRIRVTQGGRWPRGEQNIKVVGNFGRAAVPSAIKRAVMLLVLERLVPQSTGMIPFLVSQASWPDFTVTFRGDGGDSAMMGTGYVEIDRLLQPYVNYADMFLVVPNYRTFSSDNIYKE